MFRRACAIIVAFCLIVVTKPAHADYDDVDTQQPPATTQVLPKRCVGELVMPTVARPCRVVDAGARRPTVVLWGDSHSWQVTPAVIARAKETRTNLITFQMGACPPMDLRGTSARTQCSKVGVLALEFIDKVRRSGRPITVILGAHWGLYQSLIARLELGWLPELVHDIFLSQQAQLYDAGAARALATLRKWKVPSFAVGQQPTVPDNAPPCLTGATPYACALPRLLALAGEQATNAWLARRVTAVIDVTRYMCDTLVCRADYLDDLHLNPAATDRFAPAFKPAFRK